jgi:hypothetical protein
MYIKSRAADDAGTDDQEHNIPPAQCYELSLPNHSDRCWPTQPRFASIGGGAKMQSIRPFNTN